MSPERFIELIRVEQESLRRFLLALCSGNEQEADDIAFLNDEPENYVVLGVGNIAIIFPADAHAPLLGSGNYKKAVFKVHVGNNRSRLVQ